MNELPPSSTQVDQSRICFLDPPSVAERKVKISCLGRERCREDYRISRLQFAGYGIEFVAAGSGMVFLDGRSSLLRAGTVFCYGPKTSHVITTNRHDVMTKYFVDFFGQKAAMLLSRSALQPGKAVHTFEIDRFRTLYEAMIEEADKGSPLSPEICLCYLEILFLRTRETISPEGARLSHAAANFQRCRSFIDTHFSDIDNLNDLAKHIHLTPAYLCRLFQKFGHPGPFQYLTRKKLSRAAEILVGEGRAVKEAAAEVGYSDPYHFSRLFGQFFGMSPTAFVRNRRK